jgi:hypothetical protein
VASIDLSGILTKVGAPFLKQLVEGTLPPPWNGLGGVAVDVLADRLGVDTAQVPPGKLPEAVVERYEANPNVASAIIKELEADPAVILAGVEQQKETNTLLLAEMKEPLWTWAWRPLGMYGLGFLWMWNVVILHLLNAVLKWALPPTDLWLLLQLSGLYMTLYMGGHTLKDFIAKKWGGAS